MTGPSRASAPGIHVAVRTQIVLIWLTALGVHVLHGVVNLTSASNPYGDVLAVYPDWMARMDAGTVPGIDEPFVYPLLALVPMRAADLIAHGLGGREHYGLAWLVVVGVANAIVLTVLTLVRPSGPSGGVRRLAAWWWLAFTLLLGPIALGRIDAIVVPFVVVGLLALRRSPGVAGALLTIGAWIKVWPAAAFLAVVAVADRARVRAIVGAAVVCVLVVGGAVLAGGWPAVLSFVTQQTGRGLQIESIVAAPVMLADAFGVGGYRVAYDTDIKTFQITGPLTAELSALGSALMAAVVVLFVVLGVMARRSGASAARVLPPLVFGLVLALIVTNKVGSPQFATWIGAVVAVLIVWDAKRAFVPAVGGLFVAGLTQIVYPWGYDGVTGGSPFLVLVLVARNVLYVVLLVWSARELGRLRQRARSERIASPT